jgi:selenocysteine lyase/cysteine desulfurase
MMAAWGQAPIAAHLAMLNRRIADGVAGLPVTVPAERVRAPHVLSLGFPRGMPEGLIERLAAEQVHVASRLGRMRISPHVYNDEADADALVGSLQRMLG